MELVAFITGGFVVGVIMQKRFKKTLKTEKMVSFMAGYQRGLSESDYRNDEECWG